jgi:hypothetical protein
MPDPAVQWAVAGLFAALGGHSLWRLVTSRRAFAAAGYLLHLGMNAVMVAMVWPWWSRLPALPQVAFFVLAAVFFACAAGWFAVDALPRGPADGVRPTGHHESARALATHAVMMLAMVWAVVVMSPGVTAPGGAGPAAAQAHHAGHLAAPAQLSTWSVVGGALLVSALVIGGSLFVVDLVRHLRCGRTARDGAGHDLVASAAMSFGTAAMCWLMLAG